MFFGFISVISSAVYFDLGFIVAMPAWLILEIASWITRTLSKLPLAAFEVPWFNYFHVIGYYFLCLLTYFIHPYLRSIFDRTRRLNVDRLPVSNVKGIRDDSGSGL